MGGMPGPLSEFSPEGPEKEPDQEPWRNLSQSQRDTLGRRLCDQIDASIVAQGSARRNRWLQIKKLHDVDETTITMTFVEGMKPFVFPLLRQKCDRIVGAVFNGLTSIYPAVQIVDESDGTGTNKDDVERALDNVSKLAGRNKAIKQGVRTAFITNRAVWLIYPEVSAQGTVTGICWKNLHPENVVVFPPEVSTWEEAQTIGHLRYEQYWQIRRKMKSGEYFTEDMVKGGDDPEDIPQRERETKRKGKTTESPTEAAKVAKVYEVVTWLDIDSLTAGTEDGEGDYSRYVVTVAYTSKKVLKIEPYPYPKTWYVPLSLVEGCEDQVWPDDSIGQTVQQQQLGANDIATIIGQGSLYSAAPPIIMSGGTMLNKKAERYGPAEIIYADEGTKVDSFPTNFVASNLFPFLELLEMNVDSLTGITRQTTGENAPQRETATASVQRAQGQAEAKDNYSDQAAEALQDAASLFFTYFTYHFDDLKKAYGGLMPIMGGLMPPPIGPDGQPQMIQTPSGPQPAPPTPIPPQVRLRMMNPRFEVTGRSGTNTPQLLIAKLQTALQLASMQGSTYSPWAIADKIMYALELPFPVDGLKKTPQQMQWMQKQMETMMTIHPGMMERINLDPNKLPPGEHAQFISKFFGIVPDDPSLHPDAFEGQARILLVHAIQGLIDGTVQPQTALDLVQHVMQTAQTGQSNMADQIKEREKAAAAAAKSTASNGKSK